MLPALSEPKQDDTQLESWRYFYYAIAKGKHIDTSTKSGMGKRIITQTLLITEKGKKHD